MYRLEVESYRLSRDKPDHLSPSEEAYPSHHLYGLAEILGHQKSDALYPCLIGDELPSRFSRSPWAQRLGSGRLGGKGPSVWSYTRATLTSETPSSKDDLELLGPLASTSQVTGGQVCATGGGLYSAGESGSGLPECSVQSQTPASS